MNRSLASTLLCSIIILMTFHAFAAPVLSSQFGVKADLQRMTVSLKGNVVSSARYKFTASDIGKVICIQWARSYPAYSTMPFTLNAQIKALKGTNAIIDGPQMNQAVDVSNANAYMGTNNADALQQAIDQANKDKQPQVLLNFKGTALIVPFFSERCRNGKRTDGGNLPVLTIKGNMEIKGISKKDTRLMVSSEDMVYIDSKDKFSYDLFYLTADPNGPAESKTFRDMTIIGSDRSSTAIHDWNCAFRTNYADGHLMKVLIERVDLNIKSGIDDGFSTSRGGRWAKDGSVADHCTYTIRDCEWKVNDPLAVFAQVPASVPYAKEGAKQLLIERTTFDGGGVPLMRRARYVDIGTDRITVNDAGFSFYDFNSYISDKERVPVITAEETMDLVVTGIGESSAYATTYIMNERVGVIPDHCDVYVFNSNGQPIRLQQAGMSRGGTLTLNIRPELSPNITKGTRLQIVTGRYEGKVIQTNGPRQAIVEWKNDRRPEGSSVSMLFNDDGRGAEGHTMYIHPNVSCRFNGLTIKHVVKLALHHYSGGGVRGNRAYFEVNGLKVIPDDTFTLEHGKGWMPSIEFTMDNDSLNIPIKISNSAFKLYQTTALLHATDTRFMDGQCNGGTFIRCKGRLEVWGKEPSVFTDCDFDEYVSLRAAETFSPTITINNSRFSLLNVNNVGSLRISDSQIKTMRISDAMRAREDNPIRLTRTVVKSRE